MTPKDEAIRIFNLFYHSDDTLQEIRKDKSKELAIIMVDEIISAVEFYDSECHGFGNYWQEVKQEIEKI